MGKQQDDAYREAIEEYRAVSRARIAKLSEPNLSNIVGVLPRRQISNYFVQFRKVLQIKITVPKINFYVFLIISLVLILICFQNFHAYSRLQIILY